MAAAAPLIYATGETEADIRPSVGRRALDVTWAHFIRNGGLHNGNITQGYCGPDPRIVDNYSGAASCLWGLRSLIVGYYKAPDSPFWRDPPGKLPIELGDYKVSIAPAQWQVVGMQNAGTVEVNIPTGSMKSSLEPYSWWRRLAGAVLHRPVRPDNTAAKYKSARYWSSPPFCGCSQ
jgi:hypothetical protein